MKKLFKQKCELIVNEKDLTNAVDLLNRYRLGKKVTILTAEIHGVSYRQIRFKSWRHKYDLLANDLKCKGNRTRFPTWDVFGRRHWIEL